MCGSTKKMHIFALSVTLMICVVLFWLIFLFKNYIMHLLINGNSWPFNLKTSPFRAGCKHQEIGGVTSIIDMDYWRSNSRRAALCFCALSSGQSSFCAAAAGLVSSGFYWPSWITAGLSSKGCRGTVLCLSPSQHLWVIFGVTNEYSFM